MDTEGDNLWAWKPGDTITTDNARYIQRFQDLCNAYGFKPTWLTNYEMINDTFYVDFISKVESNGQGELGMHLHAWNSPPEFHLNQTQTGQPYLIEYPAEIMEEKIACLDRLIMERTGIKATSHRAGRWAMNNHYFYLLIKYGYTVDCSVTPGVNWKSSIGATEGVTGTDYTHFPRKPYWIEHNNEKILEVPVTIRTSHKIFPPKTNTIRGLAGSFVRAVRGTNLWLRPEKNNLSQMLKLLEMGQESDDDYIMFMLHSSELMTGGSPNFTSFGEIEGLYREIETIFSALAKEYEGVTLREYYSYFQERNIKKYGKS